MITKFSEKSQSCREAEGFDDTSQAEEGDTQTSCTALGFQGHGFSHSPLQAVAAGGLSNVEESDFDLAKGGEGAHGITATRELGFSERQRC